MSRFKSLKAWLNATHTTQAKLAQDVGVTPQCISNILRGQQPGYHLALRIRDRTGLPLTVLKPEPKPAQPEQVAS